MTNQDGGVVGSDKDYGETDPREKGYVGSGKDRVYPKPSSGLDGIDQRTWIVAHLMSAMLTKPGLQIERAATNAVRAADLLLAELSK